MIPEAEALYKKVTAEDSLYKQSVIVQRPYTVIVLHELETGKKGIGFACAQIPDLWDEDKGRKIALRRACLRLLGIPNPNLDDNILLRFTAGVGRNADASNV